MRSTATVAGIRPGAPAAGAREGRDVLLVAVYASVPLLAMCLYDPPPRVAFWWELWMVAGVAGMGVLALLPALSARYWVRAGSSARAAGMVHCLHRYLSYALVLLLAAHVAGLLILEPQVVEYLKLSAPWPMLAGVGAAILILVLVVTSVWRAAIGWAYRSWRRWHALLSALAVGLAAWHLAGSAYYFDRPGKVIALLAVCVAATGGSWWYDVSGSDAHAHPAHAPERGRAARNGMRRAHRWGRRVVLALLLVWGFAAVLFALPDPAARLAAAPQPCATAACG